MNAIKIRSRKALKFLGLLISAMVIATASAQVYRYMFIDGSIVVGTQEMSWILGDEAPTGSSISGTTAILNGFPVDQGTPANFTEALFLRNNNVSETTFNYTITITNELSSTDFERAKMHIYQNYTVPWTHLYTMDLTNPADSYSEQLGPLQHLRMTFEVNATMTASGTYNFDLQLEYVES
jgi:hypothetical protein